MFWRIMGLLAAAGLAACGRPVPLYALCSGEDLKSGLLYADCGQAAIATAQRVGPGRLTLIDRVMLYSVSGDFDGPIQGLSPVNLFYPVSASALVNRAVANVRAGYYRDAIDDLDAALNFNPVAADAYYARGRIYGLTGSPRQARADLNEA